LKARLLAIVPSDDALLSWLKTEEPAQLLAVALAAGMPDDAAICVATALASSALLTAAG